MIKTFSISQSGSFILRPNNRNTFEKLFYPVFIQFSMLAKYSETLENIAPLSTIYSTYIRVKLMIVETSLIH